MLGTYQGKVRFGTDGGSAYSTSTLEVGKWYNLVMTAVGAKDYLYINGALNNTYTKSFTSTSSQPLTIGARRYATTTNSYFTGLIDEVAIYNKALTASEIALLYAQGASQIVYHHADHLSGSNVETDKNGNVLEVMDYYPFGSVRLDQKSGSYQNNYKYTGKELDADTGLYYYGARYYNSDFGRFVSIDPLFLSLGIDNKSFKKLYGKEKIEILSDPQELNSYSYVKNNPLKYVDPTGQDAKITVDSRNNTITIAANIYIYGKDATNDVAKTMQADIMREWNNGLTYYDNGKNYKVNFDVKVICINTPTADQIKNKNAEDNFIEIDNNTRSYVLTNSGYLGKWRGNTPDAAPHEFGHLIGLKDRYTNSNGVEQSWSGNIMAEGAMKGKTNERNTNLLISPYMEQHNNRWFQFINKVTSYNIAPRDIKDYK